jgi:hypothetical protein
LDSLKATADLLEKMYLRGKKDFIKALEKYQDWKEKNEIPGIKY